MQEITTLCSRTVVLPQQNIDTDQIIAARYLKTTEKKGLGRWLFADWRYQPDGSPKPEFPLNQATAAGAHILVAGDNFGCGSSREHAPWALVDYGFRAVISSSIADIFKNNAVKNGLVPVVVPPALHADLLAQPGVELIIDLERLVVVPPSGAAVSFALDPFARFCLMQGVDELGFLLEHKDAIARFEEAACAR